MSVIKVSTAIIRLQSTLSQKGLAKVRVVAAGELGNLTNVRPLRESSSDAIRNIASQLAERIGKDLEITITDIMCDLKGRLAITAAADPSFLERLDNSGGNLEVMGHKVVLELTGGTAARLFMLFTTPVIMGPINRTPAPDVPKSASATPAFNPFRRVTLDAFFPFRLAALSPDNKYLVLTASSRSEGNFDYPEENVYLYDISADKLDLIYKFDPALWGKAAAWDPDNNRCAVIGKGWFVSGGSLLLIYNRSTGRPVIFDTQNSGFLSQVTSCTWHPSNNILAVAGECNIRLLDVSSQPPQILANIILPHQVAAIAYSPPDGRFLAALGLKKISILDSSTYKTIYSKRLGFVSSYETRHNHLSWDSAGHRVAIARRGKVHLVNLGNNKMTTLIPKPRGKITALAWVPKTNILITGWENGAIKFIDAESGILPFVLDDTNGGTSFEARNLMVSSDAKTLVSVHSRNRFANFVALYDLENLLGVVGEI